MFIGKLSMPRQAEWNTPRGGTQQRFFFLELACVAEIEPATVAPMKSSTKISTVAGAHPVISRLYRGGHARAGKKPLPTSTKQQWKART